MKQLLFTSFDEDEMFSQFVTWANQQSPNLIKVMHDYIGNEHRLLVTYEDFKIPILL